MTVWHYANGGTWSESNGALALTMGRSSTSGTLRFVADKSEVLGPIGCYVPFGVNREVQVIALIGIEG
jgi:Fungal fruit body lectin